MIFAYDDAQEKINPLFTKTVGNITNGKIALARPIGADGATIEETWVYEQGNKLYMNQKLNEGSGFFHVLVSYSKNSNLIKKEVERMNPVESYNSSIPNGKIDRSSFFYYPGDNKFYFNSFLKNSASLTSGNKLHYLDQVQNNQVRVSKKNPEGYSDYLEQFTLYDNKFFYISRTPSADTVPSYTTDVAQLKAELVYYDPLTTQLKRIYTSSVNGAANILGVQYGKLFFSMPSAGNKESVYYFDGLTQSITKIYETAVGDKIYLIPRYTNFAAKSGIYFTAGPANSSGVITGKNLFQLQQSLGQFIVTKVLHRSDVYFSEFSTMFSYNSTLFFSCGEGGDYKLNSLCAYSDTEKTFSFILNNVAPITSPDTLPGQRPLGMILVNNRVYFSGASYNPSTSQVKYGVYEMCLLLESGCAP